MSSDKDSQPENDNRTTKIDVLKAGALVWSVLTFLVGGAFFFGGHWEKWIVVQERVIGGGTFAVKVDYEQCSSIAPTDHDGNGPLDCPINYVLVGGFDREGHRDGHGQYHPMKCCGLRVEVQ